MIYHKIVNFCRKLGVPLRPRVDLYNGKLLTPQKFYYAKATQTGVASGGYCGVYFLPVAKAGNNRKDQKQNVVLNCIIDRCL